MYIIKYVSVCLFNVLWNGDKLHKLDDKDVEMMVFKFMYVSLIVLGEPVC